MAGNYTKSLYNQYEEVLEELNENKKLLNETNQLVKSLNKTISLLNKKNEELSIINEELVKEILRLKIIKIALIRVNRQVLMNLRR